MKKLLLLVLTWATLAPAQLSLPKPKVTLAPIAKVTVAQGASAPVRMWFRVAPGYHINSNHPGSELLIPTVVNVEVPTDVSVAKIAYPKAEELTFPFSPDEKLSVYTGDFAISALVIAAKSTPRGTYRVHGNLRYQACDNRACYPPTNVPLEFDVTVAKPAVTHAARGNPAQSPHVHK